MMFTKKFDSHLVIERKTLEEVLQFNILIETAEPILNLENYTSILKALRIVAWIKRFLKNIKPQNEKI